MIDRPLVHLCLAAALTLGAARILTPGQAAARPAQSHRTYTNAAFHYVINYPGNWAVTHSKAVQFIIVAPDHNAFLTANAVPGTLALAQIKTAQRVAFARLGKVQGPIDYALKQIHGIPFQTAEALVKLASGRTMDVLLLDTDQHATFYDFNAGVETGAAMTDRETTALDNALNSITLGA